MDQVIKDGPDGERGSTAPNFDAVSAHLSDEGWRFVHPPGWLTSVQVPVHCGFLKMLNRQGDWFLGIMRHILFA